jgi:hypothetical protein
MIETDTMTPEEVKELVHSQAVGNYAKTNDHRISLNQALISPKRISIIARDVRDGRVSDRQLSAWLVGQESEDGYKIVMREDGLQFGLASKGFPTDKYPVLCGWYGGLVSAFLAM